MQKIQKTANRNYKIQSATKIQKLTTKTAKTKHRKLLKIINNLQQKLQ